jgi:hypothetical protein
MTSAKGMNHQWKWENTERMKGELDMIGVLGGKIRVCRWRWEISTKFNFE